VTPILRYLLRWPQRLPASNGADTLPCLRVVRDTGEPRAQLDRSRQLAALFVGGADRSGIRLGDDEHGGEHGDHRPAYKSSAIVASWPPRHSIPPHGANPTEGHAVPLRLLAFVIGMLVIIAVCVLIGLVVRALT
jgi:hypothetical protein